MHGSTTTFCYPSAASACGCPTRPPRPPLFPLPQPLAQPQPPSPSPLPSVLYCLLKAELYTRRTASLENCCITRVSRCRLLCSTQHKNRTLPWTTPGAHVRMRSRYLRTALLLLGVGIPPPERTHAPPCLPINCTRTIDAHLGARRERGTTAKSVLALPPSALPAPKSSTVGTGRPS